MGLVEKRHNIFRRGIAYIAIFTCSLITCLGTSRKYDNGDKEVMTEEKLNAAADSTFKKYFEVFDSVMYYMNLDTPYDYSDMEGGMNFMYLVTGIEPSVDHSYFGYMNFSRMDYIKWKYWYSQNKANLLDRLFKSSQIAIADVKSCQDDFPTQNSDFLIKSCLGKDTDLALYYHDLFLFKKAEMSAVPAHICRSYQYLGNDVQFLSDSIAAIRYDYEHNSATAIIFNVKYLPKRPLQAAYFIELYNHVRYDSLRGFRDNVDLWRDKKNHNVLCMRTSRPGSDVVGKYIFLECNSLKPRYVSDSVLELVTLWGQGNDSTKFRVLFPEELNMAPLIIPEQE